MTATNRSYPDISFVETDTEAIVTALIQSYEKFTGRTLYPADPARLFILWVADIIVQERVNIAFSGSNRYVSLNSSARESRYSPSAYRGTFCFAEKSMFTRS